MLGVVTRSRGESSVSEGLGQRLSLREGLILRILLGGKGSLWDEQSTSKRGGERGVGLWDEEQPLTRKRAANLCPKLTCGDKNFRPSKRLPSPIAVSHGIRRFF